MGNRYEFQLILGHSLKQPGEYLYLELPEGSVSIPDDDEYNFEYPQEMTILIILKHEDKIALNFEFADIQWEDINLLDIDVDIDDMKLIETPLGFSDSMRIMDVNS